MIKVRNVDGIENIVDTNLLLCVINKNVYYASKLVAEIWEAKYFLPY